MTVGRCEVVSHEAQNPVIGGQRGAFSSFADFFGVSKTRLTIKVNAVIAREFECVARTGVDSPHVGFAVAKFIAVDRWGDYRGISMAFIESPEYNELRLTP